MVRSKPAPMEILSASPGTILLLPAGSGLEAYVRTERIQLGGFPHPCPADVRLPACKLPNVHVIALVLRFARREQLTFQCWINAAELRGQKVLENLATSHQLTVHLVTDEVARSIAATNTIKHRATNLHAKLSNPKPGWSNDEYQNGLAQIDTMYPTPAALWRACERFLDA